jgi:peptidoglycan/xylan/chitin deacetylase (PgdA/CDA1 family)
MDSLWKDNSPAQFWGCRAPIGADIWQAAARSAAPVLGLTGQDAEISRILELTLGEGQFGARHWDLGLVKNTYYQVKPLAPRGLVRALRRLVSGRSEQELPIRWPVEERYAAFQWETVRQCLNLSGRTAMPYVKFWPDGREYALVLTHDIETAAGQAFVREVADLEEGMGFRSSFNFVLERYAIDRGLIGELRERGFEVGCHGLKHDGKLFRSRAVFDRRAELINAGMAELGLSGFRSPLTLRQPEWMQALQVSYDSSFFDTDPYEPIPGGTMSLWPFFLGHFIELPYTLTQDHTLTAVLGENTPRLWLEKVDFLRKYHGMALINTHPDYMREHTTGWRVYAEFLNAMRRRGDFWQALPGQAADWWRCRAGRGDLPGGPVTLPLGELSIEGGSLRLGDLSEG